jgi:hypothetical protein
LKSLRREEPERAAVLESAGALFTWGRRLDFDRLLEL